MRQSRRQGSPDPQRHTARAKLSNEKAIASVVPSILRRPRRGAYPAGGSCVLVAPGSRIHVDEKARARQAEGARGQRVKARVKARVRVGASMGAHPHCAPSPLWSLIMDRDDRGQPPSRHHPGILI